MSLTSRSAEITYKGLHVSVYKVIIFWLAFWYNLLPLSFLFLFLSFWCKKAVWTLLTKKSRKLNKQTNKLIDWRATEVTPLWLKKLSFLREKSPQTLTIWLFLQIKTEENSFCQIRSSWLIPYVNLHNQLQSKGRFHRSAHMQAVTTTVQFLCLSRNQKRAKNFAFSRENLKIVVRFHITIPFAWQRV